MLGAFALLAACAIAVPMFGRDEPQYPVLLVHGGLGHPGNFEAMQKRLAADGYQSFTVNLGIPATDVKAGAMKIDARIKEIRHETRSVKVHLVGHSMGGLSARYYIKVLDGLPSVATYTAFGTPWSTAGHISPNRATR